MLSPHHVRLWQSSLLISCACRCVLQVVLVDDVKLLALGGVVHLRAGVGVRVMVIHRVRGLRATLSAVVARGHRLAVVVDVVEVVDAVLGSRNAAALVVLAEEHVVGVDVVEAVNARSTV